MRTLLTRFLLASPLLLLGVASTLASEPQPPVTWLGVQLGSGSNHSLEGVPITRVYRDSPAHRGGVRARDVIVAVGGERISDNGDLIQAIRKRDGGSWLELTVARGDDERDLRVRLEPKPRGDRLRPLTGWIGVRVIALPPSLREHFGAPAEAGVMVFEVAAGSPAEAGGFRVGDVIYEMDGEPVVNPGDFYKRLAGAGVGNRSEFRLVRWAQELEVESLVEDAPVEEARRP